MREREGKREGSLKTCFSGLVFQAACGDDDTLRDLGAAATAVTEALNKLIQGIKDDMREGDRYDEAVEAILAATERLFRWVWSLCVWFGRYGSF